LALKKKRPAAFGSFVWIPLAVLAVVAAFFLQNSMGTVPTSSKSAETEISEINNSGGVRISECMASNRSALADEKGNYTDWVELYNSSSKDIDLTGWMLTDRMDRGLVFTFPQTTLKSRQFLIVFCSGRYEHTPGYAYHAPFKLSASGDAVILMNPAGTVVESVTTPKMTTNQSYARIGDTGAFALTDEYTPGMHNTSENHQAISGGGGQSDSPVELSEMMAENATYAKTADGMFCDWIEIHNTSGEAVNLSGYGLSDNERNIFKWRFPDVTIEPHGYLLIYCSGESRTDGELHASFKLNGEGETVILTDASGAVVDRTQYELLKTDVSWSKKDGAWTKEQAPSPGAPNDASGAAQAEKTLRNANTTGLFLWEAVSSGHVKNSSKAGVDFVELYNSTDRTIDLSGFGLSDDPTQPRKWQFPQGAKIDAGAFLAIGCNGADKYSVKKQQYRTNFRISFSGQETITLSAPDGALIDRIPMMGQRGGVSFGRVAGRDGFFYFEKQTAGAENSDTYYAALCPDVSFDTLGGIYDEGTQLFVSLSAPSGTIRYTTDCSEPNAASPAYTEPISITGTTILRAATFADGHMPSLVGTQSYLMGTHHTLPVLSVVSDPKFLFDEDIGIYVKGKGTSLTTYNYWRDWERAANAEYFRSGETVFSQGIGMRLQGQYSRQRGQKGFKLIARNAYGKRTIEGKLYPNRDFTVFDSITLRASGQDSDKLRFRDALMTSLSQYTDSKPLYQDVQPVIVYLNGEYWGHYNLRERTNADFVARHMGWEDKNKIDFVKANRNTLQGSDDSYRELTAWVKKNGADTDAKIEHIDSIIDIDNYLDYVAVQMFTGNTDLLNVKRYRSTQGDNRWRWILFDMDTSFVYDDTNSYRRWLNETGAGSGNKYDNTIFRALMKNGAVREKFFRKLNRYMSTDWTADKINARVDEWVEVLMPEMPQQFEKWGGSMKKWKAQIDLFKKRVSIRHALFLGHISGKTGMGKEAMREYFAELMELLGI
jgi:hypothetical protein